MALNTKERDALPSNDFAVPSKRALPIHDATHVKMAWKMVDRTQGLSDEERKKAREKILRKAHDLGINTDEWHAQALHLEAMAIEMPHVEDHPNKVPFSGILTRLDQESDAPLGGSMGKKVMLPKDVAEKALPSLLGMAIDFTPSLDGHDSQSKIGIITEADIKANAIHIAGFFYGADFPEEVKRIQAEKASLGFSFEAQTRLRSLDDNPLVIDYCVFTGAAVLQKDKAAYTTTALSAKAETHKMSESNEILLSKIEAMATEIAQLKEKTKEQEDKLTLKAGSVAHLVGEHSNRLRESADKMKAAGLGMHASKGHVAVLHGMADHMDAEAAQGKLPHVYFTNEWLSASSDVSDSKHEKKEDTQITEMKTLVNELKTEISDLKKAKVEASAAPERKTLSKSSLSILSKAGITPSDERISLHELNAALDKTQGITREQAIALKFNMQASGAIKE